MKKRKVDPWFPFWIDKWLFGSTRIELLPDERGVFVDLMSLSKKDDGYIRANEGVPYLENQLCGLLNIEPELLQRTIKKCIKYHKMKRLRNGTYFMLSHEVYKLSERQQRRVEKDMSETTDTMSEKADANINIKNKEYNNKIKKENKTKEKTSPTPSITFNIEKRRLENISSKEIRFWNETYPACNVIIELRKMADWLLSNPTKRKKNYRRFITNWLSRQQEKGGTKLNSGDNFIEENIEAWARRKAQEESK